MEREFKGLNIAILAVSEAGAAEGSAKLVAERLATCGHVIAQRSSIDDSVQLIRAKLLEQIADPQIDVVVVLAGMKSESAGIALDPLVTRSLNGFSDLLRMIAYQEIGSAAMLVDAEAAQCKSTFVFILPASLPAVKLALDKLLVPQLDYRTTPRNLVMALPRIAHVDTEHDDPPVAAAPAPVPWITPRSPGDAPVPPVFPARQTSQTAVRKSMSMSVAEAMPSPSASVSQVIAKASTGLSVNEVLPKAPPTATGSQPLPVENPFSAREITNVGPPPAPPPLPLPRNKAGATLPTPLPIKPPAKLIPLAALLPVPADATPEPMTPVPNVVVDKELSSPTAVAPERKMSSLADLDDEGDDLDELDEGVAEIVDTPPRGDDEVAKLFDEPPRRIEPPRKMVIPADLPPRRTDTVLPPLFDDSPRRIAEPREPRRSKGPAVALLIGGLVLAAAASVLVVTMVRRQDREARAAGDPRQGELVATRDPAPPPVAPPRDDPPFADPPPADPVPEDLPPTPTEVAPTGPTEAFQPAPDVVQPKANPPGEIEMPAADPGARKQPRVPKTPRPPRDPATAPVQDPADVLATAPVNKVEDGCDEVSCILDHYKQGCCARFKPPEPEPVVEKPSSGLPEKLDKLMVQDGIAAVKPGVIACGEQFATRGTVRISVKVSPSGKILSAGVAATPDPQLGACVAAAVKLAKFPETDEGGSFAYPFVF